MKKDESIDTLLMKLFRKLSNEFEVVDDWESDLCAIGITRVGVKNKWVYISTFNQEPNEYYFECELTTNANDIRNMELKIINKGHAKNIIELLEVINHHLHKN